MAKVYKVVSHKFIDDIVDELNDHSLDNWSVVAYVQEYGVTKLLLEREATKEETKELNDKRKNKE